jgi:hypothetical protein
LAIDGRATLTIETSRIVMKNAVATTARMRQRCGAEAMAKTYAIEQALRISNPADMSGSDPEGV